MAKDTQAEEAPAPPEAKAFDAGKQYAGTLAELAAAARFNRRLGAGLLFALLLGLVGWARTARWMPEPMIVRVDSVGRAEVVSPEDLYWDESPTDPVTRHFLHKFISDHVRRERYGVRADWSRSLMFTSKEVTAAAIARDSAEIAAVQAGTAPERRVERVVVRIHPQPEPPHQATATYDLITPDGRGGWTQESWTATMRFEFIQVTNPEFALVNPIGLVVSFLRLEPAIGS
ncbi:MAG: hypothetical protein F4057_07200 [Acidobacteria bacterium]|nr:hypothetical protein [Acidobacteriota bacterium]MYI75100.1 hypothetical protein [Acidobacteriota bacterium]